LLLQVASTEAISLFFLAFLVVEPFLTYHEIALANFVSLAMTGEESVTPCNEIKK
jgi:hypothetical protein